MKIPFFNKHNLNVVKAFWKYIRGLTYSFNNNKLRACQSFAEAVKMCDNAAHYHAMHGIALIDLNSYEAGINALRAALERGIGKESFRYEVYGFLGYAYNRLKRAKEAIYYYEKALTVKHGKTTRINDEMIKGNLKILYNISDKEEIRENE